MQRTISLESDLIGSISAHLRDLSGFATLVAELTQNADDARDATEIRFDVREDALVVSNDGTFSSCGDPTSKSCRDDLRCDLHSFRRFAGQSKREKEDTTGAFGIGFTVVYQVTDEPELISSGQHWILRPHREDAKERIAVCDGCQDCSDQRGTVFRLPWASRNSPTRDALGVDPVTSADQERFLEEVGSVIEHLPLFLKRIDRLVLADSGELVKEVTTVRNGFIQVSTGRSIKEFVALEGNFEDEAEELKSQHRSIEKKRSSGVVVAVPKTGTMEGRPYATLPTNQQTALNFHFNADFLPESDRKGIHLEDGYQAKWNRAALKACGNALADGLLTLREVLSAEQLWRVIGSTQLAPTRTSEVGFAEALEPIADLTAESVRESDIVPLTRGDWSRPDHAWVLDNYAEDLVALLEELEVPVAHPVVKEALRETDLDHFGLKTLDLQALRAILIEAGLDESTAVDELPGPLRAKGRLEAVWNEAERLLKRERGTHEDLAGVAIFPDTAGFLHPPERLVSAEQTTVDLFSTWMPFLNAERLSRCVELRSVIDDCNVESVVEALFEMELHNESKMVDWFAARAADVLEAGIESDVAELAIFENSSGAFHALTEISLPVSGFEDPIGIAQLASDDIVNRHRSFLAGLGASELTLSAYLEELLPKALQEVPENSIPPWVDPLLAMLAEQMTGIDGVDVCALVDRLPIVPTNRGLRAPGSVYLPSEWVTKVLGSSFLTVVPDVSAKHSLLFSQLGIPDKPRPEHVMARVEELVVESPQPSTVKAIGEVLRFIIWKFGEGARDTERQAREFDRDYGRLRKIKWLPAVEDESEWYKPCDVIRISQRHLVGNQMPILDEPTSPGKTGRPYRLLGIPGQPPVNKVVDNLLDLAGGSAPPHPEIYSFLDRNDEDEHVAGLANQPCFFIGGKWLRPDQVYRKAHSLSPLRETLPSDIQRYPKLLVALNVYDEPGANDGIDVLLEIAERHGKTFQSSAKELEAALWEAWRLICSGLESGDLDKGRVRSKLEAKRVVPHRDNELAAPKYTFVADLPGLENDFSDKVANAVIEPRAGTGPALGAAGVRGLFAVAETEIRGEAVGPKTDPDLSSHLHDLRGPIMRVAEHVLGGDAALHASGQFDLLKIIPRTNLESRLSLRYGEFAVDRTDWVPCEIAYVRGDHVLYRSAEADLIDECDLARQLSRALAGDSADAVGTISLFAHVLGCADEEDANSKLDGLAIPRFVLRPKAKVKPLPPAGDDDAGSGTTDTELGPDGTPDPNDGAEEGPGSSDGQGPSENTLGTAENLDPGGEEKPRPGPKPPRKKTKQSTPSEQWAMIASYGASEDPRESEPGSADAKKAVENVGVWVAMNHERSNGRVPEEMPVNNPGFDIQSADSEGEIVRYIEVKAISGRWGTGGFPKLTPTQIEKARDLEDRFWLYVIEHAESDSPSEPIRIQDPYRSATRFVFDDGWRLRAESEQIDL